MTQEKNVHSPHLRVIQLCAVDFTVRQFIAPVAQALSADGHRVTCVCSRGPHEAELEAMGLDMVYIPIARSASPFKALGSVRELVRYLRKERPDVLHVHTPVASMVGRLAGKIAGVPTIVYTAHGFYFHDRMTRRKRLAHVTLERVFGMLNDWLFCVSREDVETAKRLRFARRNRIVHMPNGADSKIFKPSSAHRQSVRSEFSIPEDSFVIGIMGRLVREKGYVEFLTAARSLATRFPHVRFLLIGDTVSSEHDDAKTHIAEMAKVPELDGLVHFAGLRNDAARLLAGMDAFCLPSYREGMPVSVIEAMHTALPVVATRIRGCREVAQDGETGFLVEPESSEEIEGALAHLIEHPERARLMGNRGRTYARKRHELRRCLAKQVRIYRRLARRFHR